MAKTTELSTDPKQVARREADKKKREELNANKKTVREFMATAPFAKLPENVKSAIEALCRKPMPGGGGGGNTANSLNVRLSALFPKVGATQDLLGMFKAEQWGLAETRNKVREAMQKASKDERLWIDYDEKKEVWTLVAIGGAVPKNFSLTVPKSVRIELGLEKAEAPKTEKAAPKK